MSAKPHGLPNAPVLLRCRGWGLGEEAVWSPYGHVLCPWGPGRFVAGTDTAPLGCFAASRVGREQRMECLSMRGGCG